MLKCPSCGNYLNKDVDENRSVEWCDNCEYYSETDFAYEEMMQANQADLAYGPSLGEYISFTDDEYLDW